MSASGTRRCTTSPTDCARVSPSESAASYWPFSSRSAANARRQVSVCPFIVLPARMPTTGTRAMPVGGTVRVSRMISDHRQQPGEHRQRRPRPRLGGLDPAHRRHHGDDEHEGQQQQRQHERPDDGGDDQRRDAQLHDRPARGEQGRAGLREPADQVHRDGQGRAAAPPRGRRAGPGRSSRAHRMPCTPTGRGRVSARRAGRGRRGGVTASGDFAGRVHLWQTGWLRPVDSTAPATGGVPRTPVRPACGPTDAPSNPAAPNTRG